MSSAAANASPNFDLGFRLGAMTDAVRERFKLPASQAGVPVMDVEPIGAAAASGIKPGDVFAKVEQVPVTLSDEVEQQVSSARAGGQHHVLFLVRSRQTARWVAVLLTSRH